MRKALKKATKAAQLIEAAKIGNLELVRTLLLAREMPEKPLDAADSDEKDQGSSLLDSDALSPGVGVNLNEVGLDNRTALHWAARGGYADIVDVLTKAGADVDKPDSSGKTALHWAAKGVHKAAVKQLLAAGADVHKQDGRGWSPLRYAGEARDNQKSTKLSKQAPAVRETIEVLTSGKTPLHYAVENGDVDAVKALLESGAAIDKADNKGKTPLHYAAEKAKNMEIVEAFIGKGRADAGTGEERFVGNLDKQHKSARHYAIDNGCAKIAERLRQAQLLENKIVVTNEAEVRNPMHSQLEVSGAGEPSSRRMPPGGVHKAGGTIPPTPQTSGHRRGA
jgi:ankyrin repeat protein